MENRIKLKEATLQARADGTLTTTNGILADKLFPSTNSKSSSVTFYKYMRGQSFMIDRDTINRICSELNCSPNFLFGHDN